MNFPYQCVMIAPEALVDGLTAIVAAKGDHVRINLPFAATEAGPATHYAASAEIGPDLAGLLFTLDHMRNDESKSAAEIATATGIELDGYTPEDIAAVLDNVTIKIRDRTDGQTERAFLHAVAAAEGLVPVAADP